MKLGSEASNSNIVNRKGETNLGAYISVDRHIHISNMTSLNGILKQIGYMDISNEMINDITSNSKLKLIQISDYLPDDAYKIIDRILFLRPDISFRIFHFLDYDDVDISFLREMPNLRNLQIDCIDFKNNQNRIDFSILEELKLKKLTVSCFDLRNYEFIQNLSEEIESLSIMADTMGSSVKFDCKWLLRYKRLNTLWLGKKAKKNIECISQIDSLKSLSLRGIKVLDFSFLKQMHLEKLALLWNSNNDLHELAQLTDLKEIELWRVNKLKDISFLEELTNLEIIKLQDLKHVISLPDLRKHTHLQKIYLIDTGIDVELLPTYIKYKTTNWDER